MFQTRLSNQKKRKKVNVSVSSYFTIHSVHCLQAKVLFESQNSLSIGRAI